MATGLSRGMCLWGMLGWGWGSWADTLVSQHLHGLCSRDLIRDLYGITVAWKSPCAYAAAWNSTLPSSITAYLFSSVTTPVSGQFDWLRVLLLSKWPLVSNRSCATRYPPLFLLTLLHYQSHRAVNHTCSNEKQLCLFRGRWLNEKVFYLHLCFLLTYK